MGVFQHPVLLLRRILDGYGGLASLLPALGFTAASVAEDLPDFGHAVPASSSLIGEGLRLVGGRYHPGWVGHRAMVTSARELHRFLERAAVGVHRPREPRACGRRQRRVLRARVLRAGCDGGPGQPGRPDHRPREVARATPRGRSPHPPRPRWRSSLNRLKTSPPGKSPRTAENRPRTSVNHAAGPGHPRTAPAQGANSAAGSAWLMHPQI